MGVEASSSARYGVHWDTERGWRKVQEADWLHNFWEPELVAEGANNSGTVRRRVRDLGCDLGVKSRSEFQLQSSSSWRLHSAGDLGAISAIISGACIDLAGDHLPTLARGTYRGQAQTRSWRALRTSRGGPTAHASGD